MRYLDRPEQDSSGPAVTALRRSWFEQLQCAPRGLLLGTLAGIAAYLLAMHFTSGNRPEQFLICGFMLVLLAWSDATRRFFTGVLPLFLFGVIYDLTHLTEPLVAGLQLPVHVAEPYHFDQAIFGIPAAAGRLTPNEFFAIHHWPAVDFVTGLAYIVFIYWAVAFAIFLAVRRGPEARRLLMRFGWTFLFLNLAGFATYYVYPAAPPWYVTQYGLGPVNYAAQASAAAAARWDALTGIPYFVSFYGRSADVFGAIPSLHVAYPLMVFLYGRVFRKRWLDVGSFGFFLLVCFSAVYLQHHYMLDVLLGVTYTLAAYGVERAISRRWAAGTSSP